MSGEASEPIVLVAGVDSSTQGCKVVICDSTTGRVVRAGRASHPTGTEVDPIAWLHAFEHAIAMAGGLTDVKAISVAGQQHGLVCLDAQGNVVRPALLWNDTRSASSARDLIRDAGGPEVYARRVGIVPVASFTASKLRWLRDHEPEHARQVAAVCLPHDWLTWRLMGYGPDCPDLEALTTDASDASGTAYWSGETREYDRELFELALGRPLRVARLEAGQSADAVIVPRVLKPDEVAGHTPTGIVVGAGAGDNAGGALGLCAKPGDVVVSLGTSGAVFALQQASYGHGDPSGLVAYFSSATGVHLPLACTLNGARVLEAAARVLGLKNGAGEIAPLALEAPRGSEGLVLLPYFEGERTPNLPQAKASLHNMTLSNMRPATVARCYVESLLCSMAQAMRAVTRNIRLEHARLFLIGGAAANSAVQEVAATVFDVGSIYVPTPGEYVARGAALQAAWAYTQEFPDWTAPVDTEIACQHDPAILQRYEEVQLSVYPELRTLLG